MSDISKKMDEWAENGEIQDYPEREGRTKPVRGIKRADGVEVIEGKDVIMEFDGKACIHSRFCVMGAPDTFLANVDGPWLYPDDADPDLLYAIGRECASGAIRIHRKDGGQEEAAPKVNILRLKENGPLSFHADLAVHTPEGSLAPDSDSEPFNRTLCRCGKSQNKPYCDGSHHDAGFQASGEREARDTAMPDKRDGKLDIRPQPNGPLAVSGHLEICGGTGALIERTNSCRLCRCGASANKPFCDGSHAKVGFKAP